MNVIYVCPRCGQKNRLPDAHPSNGEFVCGRCRTSLTAPRMPPAVLRLTLPMKRIRLRLPGRPPLWLVIVTMPYLMALSLITLFTAAGAEKWWITCLNLYTPQWIWGIPAAALLLLCLAFSWRWTWLPLLLLAWVAGPIMGFCWGTARSAPREAPHLRVMTYNVKWGRRNSDELAGEVRRQQPDLLLLQDSLGVLDKALGAELAGWNIRVSGQYIVASRLPLAPLEWLDLSSPGVSHHAVRARLTVAGIPVTICTAHLLSPRYGLLALGHRDTTGIENNAATRLIQAKRLVEYLRHEHGPLILAGDMNAPDQAIVCRLLRGIGLRDAFAGSGRGYGYTYGRFTKAGYPYVRIDHVLVSPQWGIARCFVGTSEASDHCPVIADLFLTARSRESGSSPGR